MANTVPQDPPESIQEQPDAEAEDGQPPPFDSDEAPVETAPEKPPRGHLDTTRRGSRKAKVRKAVPSPVHKAMLGRDVATMVAQELAKRAEGAKLWPPRRKAKTQRSAVHFDT